MLLSCRRMVNKLRAALDATPILPATPTASVRRKSEDMSVKSTPKQFEAFLRCASYTILRDCPAHRRCAIDSFPLPPARSTAVPHSSRQNACGMTSR